MQATQDDPRKERKIPNEDTPGDNKPDVPSEPDHAEKRKEYT